MCYKFICRIHNILLLGVINLDKCVILVLAYIFYTKQ